MNCFPVYLTKIIRITMIYAVYTRSLLRMSVTEAKIDEVEAALKKKVCMLIVTGW